MAEAAKRGEPLGRMARELQELLDVHGHTQMTAAVTDASAVVYPTPMRFAWRCSAIVRNKPHPRWAWPCPPMCERATSPCAPTAWTAMTD